MEEKKKMRKNIKIILGIVLGIILLCSFLCVGTWITMRVTGKSVMDKMTIEDAKQAKAFAHNILDYDLHPGL